VNEGRIRVILLLQTVFDRAALPPLLQADQDLEVREERLDEALSSSLPPDREVDVVVFGAGTSLSEDRQAIHRLYRRWRVPLVVVCPAGASPGHQVAYLDAGASSTLVFDAGPGSAELLAFQSLLVSRVKLFAGVTRYVRHGSRRTAAPGTRYVLARPGAVDRTRPGGSGREREGEAGRFEVQRRFGQPRSPLEPPQGWHLVQPHRDSRQSALSPDRRVEVVVFGVGQGGVAPLVRVMRRIPADTRLALLAVVRLARDLLPALAERLENMCEVKVRVAREGDPVSPGTLLLAPPEHSLGLVRTGRIPRALCRLVDPEPGSGPVPGTDTTLRAAARIFGSGTAGAILAGVGRDGLDGLDQTRQQGGVTFVLSPDEAVVGMTNRRCMDAGLVDQVCSVHTLAERIVGLGLPAQSLLPQDAETGRAQGPQTP